MDPLSAFGLAASIVQFIDFTDTLFSGTFEIFKSATGNTKANFDLMTVTNDLNSLNQDLRSSLAKATSAGKSLSKADIELDDICKSCSDVAGQLIRALERLKTQKEHRLWASFQKALLTVWTENDVKTLGKQLQTFRMQISLRISASLHQQVESIQAKQSSHGQLLSKSLQVTQELSQSLLKQMDQNSRWQAKVIDTIRNSTGPQNPMWDARGLTSDAEDQFNFYKSYADRFQASLLQSLSFTDRTRRSDGVSYPHPETFEFIFSPTAEPKSPKFMGFLQSDQKLFWITGKPAAGKSTLMKLISDDPRTVLYLKSWAADKPLFVSRFYFWCAGTEMQMSQEGLIRTLLYEALERLPHLAPIVFSDRMETFVLLGSIAAWGGQWDMAELLASFDRLVREVTKSSKMFILIDGLDEFKGDYASQVQLLEFIHGLLSSNVKICVSSRPWNVFTDAFHARPSLKIEDFTYPDIQHYTTSNLSKNLGFVALQRGDPEVASSLIENIATKACGVFLWVVLVVQSLLEGLTDGERLSDLQRRLDAVPADLETLFWQILKSVDFERISQLFQIVEESLKWRGTIMEELNVIELSFADEEDPEFCFKIPTLPMNPDTLASRASIMSRRLNACGKGLLELQRRPRQPLAVAKVGYLHRTVKEFILSIRVWDNICRATKSSFNPAERLAISMVASFKTMDTGDTFPNLKDAFPNFWSWDRLTTSMVDISDYYTASSRMNYRLLDELGKAAGVMIDRGAPSYSFVYQRLSALTTSDPDPEPFLHLAVKLQLHLYVKHHAIRLHETRKTDILVSLFRAAVEYRVGIRGVQFEPPSRKTIDVFLELEVDPNARMKSTARPVLGNSLTIWQKVCSDNNMGANILESFLRHGANPFIPQISSNLYFVDHRNESLLKLLEVKREEAKKKGLKWDETESGKSKSSSNKGSIFSYKRIFRRRTRVRPESAL
ncbi:uncharacterized protein PAC_17312 [Phialocephala subalpina]|uniref:Uncharacterized protein n=1 Tax=Phialocephala subalpina TaxID=576137 RepID=A0A1L7XQU1_9HELO|nr:uncharacterized protein PAC_17312 [Phialocephala subalpina]